MLPISEFRAGTEGSWRRVSLRLGVITHELGNGVQVVPCSSPKAGG